jgi:hypothetical protein
MKDSIRKTWLLLIHQIPPKPDYFRIKIWRLLHQVGSIAIKQSVYILPQSDQAYEDFGWILKEIIEGGGDASLSQVKFIEGLTDDQIVFQFQKARKTDYEKLIEEINTVRNELDHDTNVANETITKTRNQMAKFQKRLNEIIAIDFFYVPERIGAENALAGLMASRSKSSHSELNTCKTIKHFLCKLWITRKNVFVDRIASAWLITRFIDKKARFKFVDLKNYKPQEEEVGFDMVEAEFTHQDDRCTFEEILHRFRIKDKALHQLGEIVHDIDLKDRKFERPEADGIYVLFSGIAASHQKDNDRIKIGAKLLDDLYTYFKGKP